MNYALARLARLQRSSGLRAVAPAAARTASAREWVGLTRDYLLLRGESDLAEVLTTLLHAAPELAPEFLELPASDLFPMRLAVARALLQNLESLAEPASRLLLLLTTYGCAASVHDTVSSFVARFCAAASAATGRATDVGEHGHPLLDQLEEECRTLPLDEQWRGAFQDAILRLQFGARPAGRPSNAEAYVATVTKEIFLDAFDRPDHVPVHLRISLSPEAAVVRDAVVSLRADHPDVEIVASHRTLEIPWLRGRDPLELTCLLRRRAPTEGLRGQSATRDLVLEVSDVGMHHEGVLLAGTIPYKGRRLSVQIHPVYPYAARPNPYSPGPAIRDLALIKGRDEEAGKILQTLRGRYQDNVPLVWGARRIGKTTLLYKVKLDPEIRRHYEPVVCDMEGLVRQDDNTVRFLARLARHISQELQGTHAGRIPVPQISAGGDPLDDFQSFLDKLAAACGDRTLLLMFDEMELFFDVLRTHQQTRPAAGYDACLHEDIIRLLRHNMQHNPRLGFILSGTKKLLEIAGEVGERLFHLPVPVQVGELSEPDALSLVEEPVGDIFRYSTAAKKRLLQLTERHPYLLQAMCHEVFSFMQTQRLSVCSEFELDRVIRERVFEQPSYFEFQVRYLGSSPPKLSVARAVAELTQEARRADIGSIRGRLQLQEDSTAYGDDLDATMYDLVAAGTLAEWRGEYRFRLPIVGAYLAHTIAHR